MYSLQPATLGNAADVTKVQPAEVSHVSLPPAGLEARPLSVVGLLKPKRPLGWSTRRCFEGPFDVRRRICYAFLTLDEAACIVVFVTVPNYSPKLGKPPPADFNDGQGKIRNEAYFLYGIGALEHETKNIPSQGDKSRRERCTPVQIPALKGVGALHARGSATFIAPPFLGLKREEKIPQVGGGCGGVEDRLLTFHLGEPGYYNWRDRPLQPSNPKDFRTRESRRVMPLVGGFPRRSPVSSRPCISALLGSHPTSPSLVLKTSIGCGAMLPRNTEQHGSRVVSTTGSECPLFTPPQEWAVLRGRNAHRCHAELKEALAGDMNRSHAADGFQRLAHRWQRRVEDLGEYLGANEFGLSVLDAVIGIFESILHLSYKLPMKVANVTVEVLSNQHELAVKYFLLIPRQLHGSMPICICDIRLLLECDKYSHTIQ
ncbi:hypothetical protein PR048_010324 [Dryococelus australis]|uniref:Uncharacterized protein n=1 Tax=Dryococelus australis TaxID=614101 RepID=A0ABQ9I3J2_9NEOP|nr:hypothetical protein PR048_010324 [Dryococelus australis]